MSDEAYAVVITAIDSERKIVAIKRVREITGLGLADAKSMVENLPSKILDGLYASQASELCDLLTSVGMRVERQVDRTNPPTVKNLQQMSFDDSGELAPGEEINIPIEGGGYVRISRGDDELA
jgi:ribosomal L7/L12-like protein